MLRELWRVEGAAPAQAEGLEVLLLGPAVGGEVGVVHPAHPASAEVAADALEVLVVLQSAKRRVVGGAVRQVAAGRGRDLRGRGAVPTRGSPLALGNLVGVERPEHGLPATGGEFAGDGLKGGALLDVAVSEVALQVVEAEAVEAPGHCWGSQHARHCAPQLGSVDGESNARSAGAHHRCSTYTRQTMAVYTGSREALTT